MSVLHPTLERDDLLKLLREVYAWYEDKDTKAAFSCAWIHGMSVSKEKAEECGALWERVRDAARQ